MAKDRVRGRPHFKMRIAAIPPFQIDGDFAATAGFREMLGQSHTGWIHLPPKPPKARPTGRVAGLCARGGLEVPTTRADGHSTQAGIYSKASLPGHVAVLAGIGLGGRGVYDLGAMLTGGAPNRLRSRALPAPFLA